MVYSIVRFPTQWMILLLKNIKTVKPEGPYEFRVAPSMTKLEIKEYLQKIYNVQVKEVRTVNHLGKYKRASPIAPVKSKLPDWKKAYVFLVPKTEEKASLPL